MELGITAHRHTPDDRETYVVASDAGEAFDAAVLAFVRWWIRSSGHTLSRRVADRDDLTPGRGIALVIEGIPLITRLTGHGEPDWDFIAWSNGSPTPKEVDGPVHLDGRVRWTRPVIGNTDGTRSFDLDAHFPEHDFWIMIRRFLNADARHIALFESTFNSDGVSSAPGFHTNIVTDIVTYHNQVMHLITPSATDEEIEAAWQAAHGWGGGERVGLLTSLTEGRQLTSGDELSDELLIDLAERTEGILLRAFDDEGFLV